MLAWLMNMGFAGGGGVVPPTPTDEDSINVVRHNVRSTVSGITTSNVVSNFIGEDDGH